VAHITAPSVPHYGVVIVTLSSGIPVKFPKLILTVVEIGKGTVPTVTENDCM